MSTDQTFDPDKYEQPYLPDYSEVAMKNDRDDELTELEQFILDNEPAGVGEERVWREQLNAVIRSERQFAAEQADRIDMHDAAGHSASAQREARDRGMAFLVDGKHVNADRVFIVSVPDTVGPISAMRTAKAEAKRALEELTMTLKVDADVATLKALDDCIALLRGCYEALASNHGVVRSETRVAIGKFLEQMAANNVPAAESKHRCTSPKGGFACAGCTCGAARKGMEQPAPVVIDGILVTDPDLAAPITDAVPGETRVCADCGKPFGFDSFDPSLFCAAHRQS